MESIDLKTALDWSELMGRMTPRMERPSFVLDLDKAREIATFANSSAPTPSSLERLRIEGAVYYASVYAEYRLDEFIEGWDETVREEGRPELYWEKLDDEQRHTAIVRNADCHFEADLEEIGCRFGERMRSYMELP